MIMYIMYSCGTTWCLALAGSIVDVRKRNWGTVDSLPSLNHEYNCKMKHVSKTSEQ